ncbi:glycosyltransferase family 10 [Chitinophaga sp. YIM B06452]|uniref:glycosyltransferase family 10 domain-containing protein n=1 Tax=Chitinophaga sp. YIM B06452 TaxID=3082158 RepID=UPI0031FE86B9
MKVKLTSFWENDLSLYNSFRKNYNAGEPTWKDMKLVHENDYDVLVILTAPHPGTEYIDPGKSITLLTEPCDSVLVPHGIVPATPMNLPLPFFQDFMEKDRTMLMQTGLTKTELLSSITSEKRQLIGQVARRQFISFLDKAIDEGLDLWGKPYEQDYFGTLRSYRGPLKNKFDGLWLHAYHFACENSFLKEYYTEKIADPILAECLCFYDGCLNLEEYVDERAFIRVNVFDPVASIEKIVTAIQMNEHSARAKYIIAQKKRLLTHLNPMNVIWMAVTGKDVMKECKL